MAQKKRNELQKSQNDSRNNCLTMKTDFLDICLFHGCNYTPYYTLYCFWPRALEGTTIEHSFRYKPV